MKGPFFLRSCSTTKTKTETRTRTRTTTTKTDGGEAEKENEARETEILGFENWEFGGIILFGGGWCD